MSISNLSRIRKAANALKGYGRLMHRANSTRSIRQGERAKMEPVARGLVKGEKKSPMNKDKTTQVNPSDKATGWANGDIQQRNETSGKATCASEQRTRG